MALYGGFAGGESSLGGRNWTAHLTILSGDIDQNDTVDASGVVTHTDGIAGSNAYNVVTGYQVTETAVLDGFTVTAGKANGSSCPGPGCGGGMLNQSGFSNEWGDPTVSHVVFSGNYGGFAGGGGMANMNQADPVLTDVTFVGNGTGDSGGGLSSDFNSYPTLIDVTFERNWAASYGGGAYQYGAGGTLAMTRTTWTSNTASRGGGLFVYSTTLVLDEAHFSGNHASATQSYGGDSYYCNGGGGLGFMAGAALTMTDATFRDNTATLSGAGVYLDNDGGTATLSDVQFTSNAAQRDAGGFYSNSGDVAMNRVTFDGNTGEGTTGSGGATLGYDSGIIAFDWVTFTHNTGAYGGGLSISAGTATLHDVIFEDNTATSRGGGMRAGWNAHLTLARVTFISNTAQYGGGMHYSTNYVANMVNITFTHNTATEGGGGMASNSSQGAVITDAVFIDNQAGRGGGMWCYYSGDLALRSTSFMGNRATSSSDGGGGLYCEGTGSGALTMDEVVFQNNQAAGDGGGLFNERTDVNLHNVTFQENSGDSGGGAYSYNSALTLSEGTFISNTARYAGGMRTSSSSCTSVVTGTCFIGNHAENGSGGVSADGPLTLTNSLFSGNVAESSSAGGLSGYGDMTLVNVTFSNNAAATYAGGMLAINPYHYVMTNTVFWGNTAPDDNSACNYAASPQICGLNSWPIFSIGHSVVQNSGGSGVGWESNLGSDGGGNLDADPLFLDIDGADDVVGTLDDDLRLQRSSPAVNAGDNSAVTAVTDLDGTPRIEGGTVDMGAYEYGLRLRKLVTPTVDVPYHGTVTYTLVLENGTLLDETGALLTDTLPAEVDFGAWIERPSGAAMADDEITWSGTLAAGEVISVSFTAIHVGDYGDAVSNTAEYQGSSRLEESVSFNVATLSDVVIHKTVMPDTHADPGDPITYTLTFSNTGPSIASGVVITDALPAAVANSHVVSNSDVSLALRSGTHYIWDVDDLAPGQGGVITITGVLSEPLAAGAFINQARIACIGLQVEISNDVSEVTVTVADVPPVVEDATVATTEDLQVSGTITAADPNGSALSYVLTAAPSFGSASVDAVSGTWVYTPINRMADYSDSFGVLVTDEGGKSDTALVSVDISADNDAPTISALADQVVLVNEIVGPLGFIVGDAETDLDLLTLDKVSSNAALVPTSAIVFGGSGADHTVTLTPTAGVLGTATITITVADEGGALNATVFDVRVGALRLYLPLVAKDGSFVD